MSKSLELVQCPRCGAHVESLRTIETGMRVALQTAGQAADLPNAVCMRCFEQLSGMVSQGVKIRLEEEAKQKNKIALYQSRTQLIKQGKGLMTQKAFPEAAVALEKYLKILEMVHNVKKGELTPELFNNSIRAKELTVVTSVYWDLFRIYDMSPKYKDRMKHVGGKLAQFLGYSTIYQDIIKRADSFQRSAKNPDLVKDFLREVRKNKPKCFIATAVFKAPFSPEVQALRLFRDHCLKKHRWGRAFVAFYYRRSPAVADWIETKPVIQRLLRGFFRFLCLFLNRS